MSDSPNKLSKLWQELKRRKVVKVVLLYATTAFILLQIVSMVVEPLNLPEWVEPFFIVLLVIGFPIAVIFSWIFDVTPEGIAVTVSSHKKGEQEHLSTSRRKSLITNSIIGVLLIVVGMLIIPKIFQSRAGRNVNPELEKSIAVLPFKNDSNDSTNVYIINGMMESILNNLSKVKDLRVLSRTSVEKYRNNPKLITELAKELEVNYIVEGSGQKIGDQILLTIQLIEAHSDKHLWSEQYNREATDIFNLQIDVSKNIVDEIQAVITPEENARIKKEITSNQTALDYYYRGIELGNKEADTQKEYRDNIDKGMSYLEKAIQEDDEFAEAYAELAEQYYYFDKGFSNLDNYLKTIDEKDSSYVEAKNIYDWLKNKDQDFSALSVFYTDKALVYDPESVKGLTTKAMYYQSKRELELAESYFKKALEYNPNSTVAVNNLKTIYKQFSNLPDVGKYLEIALLATKIEVEDSIKRSSDFYSLGSAFRWAGFKKEADEYLDESLKFNTVQQRVRVINNEKAHLMIESGKYEEAFELVEPYYDEKRPGSGVNLTLGLASYLKHDYRAAFNYLHPYIQYRVERDFGVNNYVLRLAHICRELVKNELSEEYLEMSFKYAETLESNYKYYYLSTYNVLINNEKEALRYLKEFSETDGYAYWAIRNLQAEPIYENIRNLPEFQQILSEIQDKFWSNQERIKANLKEKGLLKQ